MDASAELIQIIVELNMIVLRDHIMLKMVSPMPILKKGLLVKVVPSARQTDRQ